MSSQRPLVLVTWSGYGDDPGHAEMMEAAGLDVLYAPLLAARSPEDAIDLLRGAVAVIADYDPFTAAVLASEPALRLVARIGVGLDSVDIDAATERGILVTMTPGVVQPIVAEHALALTLAVLRRIVENDAAIRSGTWERLGEATPWQLTGATVGIVGYGHIGRAFAQRLQGFETTILVHDPFVTEAEGVELVSFEELLRRSDVVSLNAALTPGTEGMIGAAQLAMMKPSAVLVNTGRGRLVDEGALIDALQQGVIRGAGLDVFEVEPPASEQLRTLRNVVLSPHVAGASTASVHAITRLAMESVLAFMRGETPGGLVNPEAMAVRERIDASSSARPVAAT